MNNRVGSYVLGADFFGRDAELARLVELLTAGEHVSLVARMAAEAVAPDRTRSALQSVFEVLEHDGYLRRDPDGERRFVSSLLRDWWRRRFGEFHVSVDRREPK